MLLSSTADFAGMVGVTSGLLKQIPPVTRVEAVVWGFPTAGVEVRGGFIIDNEARVELLVDTDGKVTIGTSGGCIRPSFGCTLSSGDYLIPSCSFVSSDISSSARKASRLASCA